MRAHTADDVAAAMDEARIPVSDANDLAAIYAHPQVQHRQSLTRVPDPVLGDITMPAPLPSLGGTPPTIRSTGPALGAHGAEVMQEWLAR